MTTTEKDLLAFIDHHQIVESLLFDFNLLPEQVRRGSKDWQRMLSAVVHIQRIIAQDREEAIKAAMSARMPGHSEWTQAYNGGVMDAVKKLKELKP